MKRRILFGLFFTVVFLLSGALVMFLWNGLLPSIIKITTINYWQSLGLIALCRILFGGIPFAGKQSGDRNNSRGLLKEKLMGMDEHTRNAFKEEWRKRRGC